MAVTIKWINYPMYYCMKCKHNKPPEVFSSSDPICDECIRAEGGHPDR